jgi:acetylornithine deacetylase
LAGATQELQAIIDKLGTADPTFKGTLKPYMERPPFTTEAQAEIVQSVEAATTERLGTPPDHIGATFWSDAAILAKAGIETVLLGPVGQGLHSDEEWVDIGSVVDLAHILADTTKRYCQAR